MLDKPYVYLAAPLFNKRELDFNQQLTIELELYFRVFLPQRDGSLLVHMVEAGVPLAVAQNRVFEQDCKALANADLLIAVLDGAHIDEGVAFEIGYMRGLRKICIGLQTDVRRALPTGNNPMLTGAFDQIFSDERALLQWCSEFARTNTVKQTG